ncbi:undecaprenyl-diphosphate phosphatase [Marinomonas sp. 2405UD68-3]|uniref:undecaprenyl-diphosphate phosphatase n=1 Tax=Marinomonas sp. 2405UD68-3 TaxID=3391835 RepID=UPI0039C9C757
MLWFHIVFLSLIQGVTEFLPISSSAHLLLPSKLLDWPDQGLAFDVAVHVGSLVAVSWYFRKDIIRLVMAWFDAITTSTSSKDSQLAWWVIIATIPAVLVGLVFNDFIEENFRSINVIAYTTIIFGILLWCADAFFTNKKKEYDLTLPNVVWIGIAQAVALIPGTSRSGVTMTVTRALGVSREASARFSFLLSIPLILAAGSYKFLELLSLNVEIEWGIIASGVFLSFISAYACIYFFLKWLNTIGFTPFLFYRLFLGVALLCISYLNV